MKAGESAALHHAKMHHTTEMDTYLLNLGDSLRSQLPSFEDLSVSDFSTHGIDCLFSKKCVAASVPRLALSLVELTLEFGQDTTYIITGDGKDLCLHAGRVNCCWLCDHPRSHWSSRMHGSTNMTQKSITDLYHDFVACKQAICRAVVACVFDSQCFTSLKGSANASQSALLRILKDCLLTVSHILHSSSPHAIRGAQVLCTLYSTTEPVKDISEIPALLTPVVQNSMRSCPWVVRGASIPTFSLAMIDRLRLAAKGRFHHIVRQPVCCWTTGKLPTGPSGIPVLAVPLMHCIARNHKICMQLVVSEDLQREDASARQCRSELVEIQEAMLNQGVDLAPESDTSASHSTFLNCTKLRLLVNHSQDRLSDKAGHRGLQLLRFAELLSCLIYAPIMEVTDSFCLSYFSYSGLHLSLLRLWQGILDFRGRSIATLGSATATGNLHIHTMLVCGPLLVHRLRIAPATMSEENGEFSICAVRQFWRTRSGRDFHQESWKAFHMCGKILDMLMMGSYGKASGTSRSMFKSTSLSHCAVYPCIHEQHPDVSSIQM